MMWLITNHVIYTSHARARLKVTWLGDVVMCNCVLFTKQYICISNHLCNTYISWPKFLLLHITTLCLKNNTDVAHWNYDIHEGILIIFRRYVTKKITNYKLLYFSTSPYWCFYTTWWNRKPRNCAFYLNVVCCFVNRHTKHIKISPGHC